MPEFCKEGIHFFTCVYIIILSLTSTYLSIGFPCDPWLHLYWDNDLGIISDRNLQNTNGLKKDCWTECEAFSLRLHLLQNPQLISTHPSLNIIQSLIQSVEPNPFCYSHLLEDYLTLNGNPFCPQYNSNPPRFGYQHNRTSTQIELMKLNLGEFRIRKHESMRVHATILGCVCLDCAVVSLSIVLIYVSAVEDIFPYCLAYLIGFGTHLGSLFMSSQATQWLTCISETGQRFCDGFGHIQVTSEHKIKFQLPDKPTGINNFEVSLIIKNIITICFIIVGLSYYSKLRTVPPDVILRQDAINRFNQLNPLRDDHEQGRDELVGQSVHQATEAFEGQRPNEPNHLGHIEDSIPINTV